MYIVPILFLYYIIVLLLNIVAIIFVFQFFVGKFSVMDMYHQMSVDCLYLSTFKKYDSL